MTKLLINKTILEELFKEHYNSLYYHAQSFLNDSEVAKDTVNDCFEEVWNKRNQLDISYSLKSFLYSMVRNRSLNYLKRQEVEKKYISRTLHSSGYGEDEYQDYDSVLVEIGKAIEELPPQGRSVFKKCFIENLSYKETAEELNISVNTVKTHITNSLKRLRQDLNRDLLLFFLQVSKKK